MPLKGLGPRDWLPDCIKVYPWKGMALNAVGLSGPGAKVLLQKGLWYKQEKPFFLSFMSVGATRTERLSELREFVLLLERHLPFSAPVGLQLNFSCPNVGLDPQKLVNEILEGLDLASVLDIPLVPKVNVSFPTDVILSLQDHADLDAISVSNTIPWGHSLINWQKLFGTTTSPLARFGGGGLSGKPLLPLVLPWIRMLRMTGFEKPIIGGGGILSKADADQMVNAGADAVELGSVSMLRPWRLRGIVSHVNHRMGNGVG
jgi:dihydroorotate dehydrogenase (NAD+) catalytic subunit